MDLPINDQELNTIVRALTLGGDTALYQKLKLIKEVRGKILVVLIKKFFASLMVWLFNYGFFERYCKGDWG